MKIKQIIIGSLAVSILATSLAFFATTAPANAQQNCAGVNTSIIGGSMCEGVNNDSGDIEDSAIWVILRWVINIMAAGVAILAVGGIIYGAILYTTAAGSPEQTKKAMGIIMNVVIGVIAFALMWSFLQWLIPGGVFGSGSSNGANPGSGGGGPGTQRPV